VQIFFLALFTEKLNKLLNQLNISRISGRLSGIWPVIRYLALPDIRQANLVSGRITVPDIKKAGLSYLISGASLILTKFSKGTGKQNAFFKI
jgi:hypothetical protein